MGVETTEKRQDEEIRKSLFNFQSFAERAQILVEEDRERNRRKKIEERVMREREALELDRSAMELEAVMCWLSELGKKQSNTERKTEEAQQIKCVGQDENGPASRGASGPVLRTYSIIHIKSPEYIDGCGFLGLGF